MAVAETHTLHYSDARVNIEVDTEGEMSIQFEALNGGNLSFDSNSWTDICDMWDAVTKMSE